MKEINVNPKIVVIGGGTGNSVMLKGLKKVTNNIATIVAMGDNGGGTGVLREDLGMLPPGDIRACLLALSNIEPQMEKVLNYRFDKGRLKGQSFGNLFIAALNGVYGSFEKAIVESGNILNLTGKVYPMTIENINLVANLKNGNTVFGESQIPDTVIEQKTEIDLIELDPKNAKPSGGAIGEIENADIIVIGPGSLYTSVIPNLLVNEIREALYNTRAQKVYIQNVMTQPGETENYTMKKHISSLLKHAPKLKLDYVIANNYKIEDTEIIKRYEDKNQKQVLVTEEDRKFLKDLDINLIEGNTIEDLDKITETTKYIKHDTKAVSHKIIEIFLETSNTKEFKKSK